MCPAYTSGSVGWRGDAQGLLQLSAYPLSLKEKRASATARAVLNFGRKRRLDCCSWPRRVISKQTGCPEKGGELGPGGGREGAFVHLERGAAGVLGCCNKLRGRSTQMAGRREKRRRKKRKKGGKEAKNVGVGWRTKGTILIALLWKAHHLHLLWLNSGAQSTAPWANLCLSGEGMCTSQEDRERAKRKEEERPAGGRRGRERGEREGEGRERGERGREREGEG